MNSSDRIRRQVGRVVGKTSVGVSEAQARLAATRRRSWPTTQPNEVVFVMGSGRSGTHWLGYILESHPDIEATIETPAIFGRVTDMALDPSKRWFLFPELIELYRQERQRRDSRYYADKSHPSIWIAEYLADAIPTAKFIGIERDPYQTIASMLEHDGVGDWPRRWREFPVPNRFLGIDEENQDRYEEMRPVEQHALRWNSHHEQMTALRSRLGDRMTVLQYADLQERTEVTLRDLQRFLGLDTPFPQPEVRSSSTSKWRAILDAHAITDIAALTGVEPADG